jgi:hypothetical protein
VHWGHAKPRDDERAGGNLVIAFHDNHSRLVELVVTDTARTLFCSPATRAITSSIFSRAHPSPCFHHFHFLCS